MKKFLFFVLLVSICLFVPFTVLSKVKAEDQISLPIPTLIALPTLVPVSNPTISPTETPTETPKPQTTAVPTPPAVSTSSAIPSNAPSDKETKKDNKDNAATATPSATSVATSVATSTPIPRAVPATISNPEPPKTVQETINKVSKTFSDVINPPLTVFRSLSGYMYGSTKLTRPVLYSLLFICAITFVSGIMLLRPELKQFYKRFSKNTHSSLEKTGLSKSLSSMEGSTE